MERPLAFSNVLTPEPEEASPRTWTAEQVEAIFQTQFDRGYLGICITDVDRRWLHVNRRLCDMLGVGETELRARTWPEFIHPDDVPAHVERGRQAHAGEIDGWDADLRYITAEGSIGWARVAVAVFRRPDRTVAFFVTSAEDISERVLTLERLRSARDMLSHVLDSVPQSIFWKDRDGVYLGCNRSFAMALGAGDAAAVVGRSDYELLKSREKADGYRADDLEVMNSGQPRRNLIRTGVRDDGSQFWSDTTKIPLFDQTGKVTGVLGVHADITDRVSAEQDRLEMERRLLHAQKLESLGVLAGGIAHDFNNLLMAVLGNLDLAALQMPSASPASTSIEQAIQATRRATDLTRQMLAYSGRGQFVVMRVDLGELLRENNDLFRASISKTVTLELANTGSAAVIDGDPGQIQQVVMNLITNASDAIGDLPGTISLESGVIDCSDSYLSQSRLDEKPGAGRFAYLQVTDSGEGMDEATQQRLFDPFFTTKFTGRGLGMSAVLGIVRGHKGAILVDSTPGGGTKIRVLFRLSETRSGLVIESAGAAVTEPPKSATARTVLVVDDEAAVRRLCLTFVERLGYRGLEAEDGEHALEIFSDRAAEIDCVLLDLTMPRKDGVSTFEALRKIRPDVRVVLSSGYAEQDATQRFDGRGLTGFIQKPFRLKEFRQTMEQALAGLD